MASNFDPLYGLSGSLWPVHLKPQPDELLSSWMVRLAHAHGYKVQTMSSLLFGRDTPIWNRDIDRLAPEEIRSRLIQATGATSEQFEGTTLRAYEGTVMETFTTQGFCRWVVPLGVFHRARRRPGLMFCPQCLAQDAEPYFRRSWRLALSTVCTKHESYLRDSCPRCGAPVAPHRVDMHRPEAMAHAALIAHCWNCAFDLRNCRQEERPDAGLLGLQAMFDAAIQKGFVNWAGNPSMYSLAYFDGFRALVAGLSSRRTLERLCKVAPDMRGWPQIGIETAPLQTRGRFLAWLAQVVEDWPANFVSLVHENKLRYVDLKGDSEWRPFWYEEVIRRESGGGYAPISDEEAEAIANVVELRYGRYSGVVARELSGRDIGAHVPDYRVRAVSDDVYEQLLVSIDHQIAGTQDKIKKYCLIRDKIMFATGRVLGLSEGELAALTMRQLRRLVPHVAELNFTEMARTPAQVRAWVEWYWHKMRPLLHPRTEVEHVFTSVRTLREIRHSIVGKRFQRIVNDAMMRHSIPSYDSWINGINVANRNSKTSSN